jgi:hypothetical protein
VTRVHVIITFRLSQGHVNVGKVVDVSEVKIFTLKVNKVRECARIYRMFSDGPTIRKEWGPELHSVALKKAIFNNIVTSRPIAK